MERSVEKHHRPRPHCPPYLCGEHLTVQPSTSNPLWFRKSLDMIGPLADRPVAVSLLNGQLPLGLFTPLAETRLILSNLSQTLPLAPQEIDFMISLDQFISTYKIIQEDTLSSFSGRHVGHYKGIINDASLCELHASMISLPYVIGFILSLHQQVTAAYQHYADNPFHVAQNLRHIFFTPLSQRLLQDVDSLRCFLSTHEVALEQQ